jgi:hypothetical protein
MSDEAAARSQGKSKLMSLIRGDCTATVASGHTAGCGKPLGGLNNAT